MSDLKAASQRVIAAAATLGLDITIRTFPEGTRTAADAAGAIGCDPGAIAKSIVLHDDAGPILVLTSGRHRVDHDKVAALLGSGPVRKADADEVREATGFAIGGTAPFGHVHPLRTLLDDTLLAYDQVWAAGGTPNTVFSMTPAELLAASRATVAAVAAT